MTSDGFTTRPVYMGTHGVLAAGHYLAARAGQLHVRPRRQRHRRRRRVRLRPQPPQAAPQRPRRRGSHPRLLRQGGKSLLHLRPGLHRQGRDGRLVPQGGHRPDPRRRFSARDRAGHVRLMGLRPDAFRHADAQGRAGTGHRLRRVRLPRLPRTAPRYRRLGGALPRGMAVVGRGLPAGRPGAGRRRRVQESRFRRDAQEGGRGRDARGEARPRGRHPGRHRLVVQGRSRLHDRGFHEEDRDPRRQRQEAFAAC